MISLFSVIFSKLYFFCIKVFKEKEFPQYFASGILSIIVVLTIIVLIDIILYQINPSAINSIFKYYKYFSVASLFFFWWFLGYKKKYLFLMENYKKMSSSKRKVLTFVSVIYLCLLAVSFLGMGDIMREYNLESR